jgi:hypothetical protein
MARFRRNQNFLNQLRNAPQVQAQLRRGAGRAAGEARSIAHRIMPEGRGEQINIETDAEGVHLVNKASGAHLDEWGSAKNPPYAPLRRGTRAAGHRLDEQ